MTHRLIASLSLAAMLMPLPTFVHASPKESPAAVGPIESSPQGQTPDAIEIQEKPLAEDSGVTFIGLGFPVGLYQVRDHTLQNPHLHQGLIVGMSVDYEKENGPNRHAFSIGGGYSSLSDDYNLPAIAVVTGARVEKTRLWKHFGHQGEWALYSGAFAEYRSDVSMYPFIDDGHLYWLTSLGVGPTILVERQVLDGANASIGLRAPLFAIISRPPRERFYNNDKDKIDYILPKIFENREFRTIDTHLSMEAEAALRFRMGGRYIQTLGYRLFYTNDSYPMSTQILSHIIFLRISAQW
ncbi:MAG: hypothetical protein OEZ32_00085 [Nitrospinota bacterium]|nr:hypothetical protein [Nitrospinota bacterium]